MSLGVLGVRGNTAYHVIPPRTAPNFAVYRVKCGAELLERDVTIHFRQLAPFNQRRRLEIVGDA